MESLVREALGAVLLAALVAAPAVLWLVVRHRRAGASWGAVLRLGSIRTAALVTALAVLVVTVVLPGIQSGGQRPSAGTNWTPFATIRLFATANLNEEARLGNLLGNVAMFVPFGLALAAAARQVGRTALWGAVGGLGLSLLVEGLQYFLPVGRSTDVDDLILNTLGAGIGAVLAVALRIGRARRG